MTHAHRDRDNGGTAQAPRRTPAGIEEELSAVEEEMMDIPTFSPGYDILSRRRNELLIELEQTRIPVELRDIILTNKPI